MRNYSYKDLLVWRSACNFETSIWTYAQALSERDKEQAVLLCILAHHIPLTLEEGLNQKSVALMVDKCSDALDLTAQCQSYLAVSSQKNIEELKQESEELKRNLTRFKKALNRSTIQAA